MSTEHRNASIIEDEKLKREAPNLDYIIPKSYHAEKGHIYVRPYRASDARGVRRLFEEGMSKGDGSPLQFAIRKRMRGPKAIAYYSVIVLGLFLTAFSPISQVQYIGVLSSIIGSISFYFYRENLQKLFKEYMNKSFGDDFADISKHYRMLPVLNKAGDPSEDLEPSGKSGFWVAEELREGAKAELVGTIGLDAYSSEDETSAEIRRMVVSPDHRRQGIAAKLIKTAVAHARTGDIKSIFLSTTSFNIAAVHMYEKLGWTVVKTRPLPIDGAYVYNLDLEVNKSSL